MDKNKEDFKKLCKNVLAEIDKIDKNVQWSEIEPVWWLEMMEVARVIRLAQDTLKYGDTK